MPWTERRLKNRRQGEKMSELASFPSPRAKARFSASSFCALTLKTAGRLLRLLVKPRSLIERCSIGWSAIGLQGWPRSRVSRGSTAVADASFRLGVPQDNRYMRSALLTGRHQTELMLRPAAAERQMETENALIGVNVASRHQSIRGVK